MPGARASGSLPGDKDAEPEASDRGVSLLCIAILYDMETCEREVIN
ncbi:MAG TPA: hypothetical protein VGO91_05375 [Pyrinomonadaceae bacterium]|nr:hypothetical protein [Pyrinomonadaceae bacterium]